MYENERIVGNSVRKSRAAREDIFITTKIFKNAQSFEKAKIAVEKSLFELQTDYIDLCLIHEPCEHAAEMYKALENEYKKGRIKAIGVSNFSKEEYLRLINRCEIAPMVNQMESHVYNTRLDLKSALEKLGCAMQSWSPFTQGKKNIFNENALVRAGKNHGKTAAQTALKYLVQSGIAVIPKSVHPGRIKENFDIFDFELSDFEMRQISLLDNHISLFGW
ncbi:MAG: aldo/keto reductase [Clostridiales bacterium]|nr:aldo/keto reductase [Clostridiales bacterium]